MEFIELIKEYLDAQGVSSVLWPVRLGFLFDTTDQAIFVCEAGGLPFDTLGRENLNPTFKTIVRSNPEDYATARAKWTEVFDALADAQQTGGSPTLLPGVIFIQTRQTGPYPFTDDKGRQCLSCNWLAKVTR